MKASPARRKLYRLQRRIFRALEAESARLLGAPPLSIQRYARENAADFRGSRGSRSIASRAAQVTKAQLVQAIRSAQVSFIADYHTFAQAQRTALRLIRDAVGPDLGRPARSGGHEWLIGLELIPSQYQSALDSYQAGRIGLETFHKIIRYREQWGFPWRNYAPIFDWAREHGVRLVALNRPKELVYRRPSRADGADLHARDEWAAGIVTDLIAEDPARRMIVLYGELHVGTRHLPAQVARVSRAFAGKALSTVAIHQNNDPLYWKLARRGRELQAEGIRLRKDAYCVLSSTPWQRLQSLIAWLEGENVEEPEDASGETDPISLMRVYGEVIAEFLGVAAPSFESLGIRTIEEAGFVDSIEEAGLPREEARLVRFHVLSNQRIYVPALQAAYVGTPSQNGAAETAALHLLKQATRGKALFRRTEDDYYRLALEAAFGFFGSLVLNPRRKCDLPADHARRVQELQGGARSAYPLEQAARSLTCAMLAGARASPGAKARASLAATLAQARLAPAAMLSARQLGQILGKRLHRAVLSGSTPIEAVRGLFFASPPAQPHFARYRRLWALTAQERVEPTKSETL